MRVGRSCHLDQALVALVALVVAKNPSSLPRPDSRGWLPHCASPPKQGMEQRGAGI
jgi:hypothetical protein